MTEWHRIDDPDHPAPRDGTRILLFRASLKDPMQTGRYINTGWAISAAGGKFHYLPTDWPTHWMHIPPPPGATP